LPSLFVVLIDLIAKRMYLGFYAEVFLSASTLAVQELLPTHKHWEKE